jgi:hypothetical protein
MGGGAKVLLLLLGAGVIGGGIYYLTTKPAAAAVAPGIPPSVPAPGTTTTTTTVTAPSGTIAVPATSGLNVPAAGTSVATMVSRAVTLARVAASTGHSSDLTAAAYWAAWAVAYGANPSQLAQLRGVGFMV